MERLCIRIHEKDNVAIAKSGTSPIVEVLSPGEKPTKHGEIYAATPASDLFCGPSQLAGGRKKPYSEQYHWVNDICVFNPAPIT